MKVLEKTYSVCPVCLKSIEASYIEDQDKIYMHKTCKAHGEFRGLISISAADFLNWKTEVTNIVPKVVLTKRSVGCPHDCGPCNEHLQTPCCILLEVTDGCNQSCKYCFASANTDRSKEPALVDIEKWYDRLLEMGEARAFNIQISGGEPTIREDLPQIVKMGKDKGFEYIQLNTNGKRLGTEMGYGKILKEAGLTTVFLQFDGTNDEIYQKLRGENLLDIKKNAIKNCREAEIPVALVPTVAHGINDQNIGEIYNFMLENLEVVRGIHFQPVSYFGRFPLAERTEERMTMFDVINEIQVQTKGAIKKRDLRPLATGHNLCCFYGTFLREEGGDIKSLAKESVDCGGESLKEEGCTCCTPDIDIISKDRDFVLNKWRMATNLEEESLEGGFDQFLNHFRTNSFTLTGMAFQDASNLDVERLKRCRVQVYATSASDEKGRLIPFCAYNLTDIEGNYIYRGTL